MLTIRLLTGAVVTLVLVLSFLATRVVDDLAPAGTTDIITVWDQPTSTPGSFQALVEETAEANDLAVLKEVRRESGAAVVRHEFVANPSAVRAFRLSDHDTSGFDPKLVTRFRPISGLPDNQVNGTYLTDAGSAAADRFAAAMGDAGVTVTVDPLSLPDLVLWTTSEVPVLPLAGSVLLVVVIGVTSWQAGRRATVSITATFGRSRRTSSLRDAGGVASAIAVSGGTAMLVTVPVLVLIDHRARLGTFLVISGAGLFVVAVVAAAAAWVTATCTSGSLSGGVDGARPVRSMLVVSIICNVLVLVLATSATSSAWRIVDLAQHEGAERSLWRPALDDVRLTFTTSDADLDAAEPELAEMFALLEQSGDVVLTDHVVAPDPSSHDPDGGNVLLVNGQYLREQRLDAPSGERITPEDLEPSSLTLLVPEGVHLSGQDRRAWRDFLEFQGQTSDDPGSVPQTVDVVSMPTASHEVFDYATDDLWSTSTTRDTVVAVLPSAARSLSANLLVSDMTTGEVIFTDPARLRSFLTEHHLSVAVIEPLRDAVSYRSAVIGRALGQQLAALGVLVLVLGFSADVTARALVSSRARRTIILRTHSRSIVRTTLSTLAPTLIVLALTGTTIVVASGPDQPAAAASVALDVFLTVLATALHGFRIAEPALVRR